jgi:hypothetical protein
MSRTFMHGLTAGIARATRRKYVKKNTIVFKHNILYAQLIVCSVTTIASTAVLWSCVADLQYFRIFDYASRMY